MRPTLSIEALARAIFAHRRALLAVFALVTILLGASAIRLRVDASFDKMVPLAHPYMQTFTQYRATFGGANRVLVALVKRDGEVFDAAFLAKLRDATDAVFFMPGIDRPTVRSLFTPNARYIEIVESGFSGGNIVPADYTGTPADVARVRANVLRSNEIGRLVSNDLHGALIVGELLETDPNTGRRLDYFEVAQRLEAIRAQYADAQVDVHIIGFAKAVGDIGAGARSVLSFFALAFAITAVLLLGYTRSWRVSLLALFAALLPVVWLLGLLPLLGYGIDPMSVLVPFLIFAIGVSHAVQMCNAWRLEARAGADSLQAAHGAFMKLFAPGALALLANALGFLVIMLIRIDIVRELGITASLGVAVMVITNKVLLPVLLSWLPTPSAPTSAPANTTQAPTMAAGARVWSALAGIATRRQAAVVLLAAALLALAAGWKAHGLQTGDLGQGLPELHADARYNRDNAAITQRFAIGVDVLSVIVQSHGLESACLDYEVMSTIDRFERGMRAVPGVHSVIALPDVAKHVAQAVHEGNPKWHALPRNPQALGEALGVVDTSSGLMDAQCNAMQIFVFTEDHQGATLKRLVAAAKTLAQEHASPKLDFLLASGNAGVMAATNEAVDAAEYQMLGALFGAIGLLCLAVFRSWRATLCIVLPLALVSVLCNALMAMQGIGLKVSTLPVIALGVGVGVDYGIYLYGALRARLAQGDALRAAFAHAFQVRGGAIAFTALTMSAGVATWAYSALKFQADMGVLLAFMFLVNMVAAMLLLPALAAWLLPRRAQEDRA